MAKISTYDNASPVSLTDKVIGTSVGGSPSDATKNFLLSDILALFEGSITLSDVLTAGNTATNNIVLTGDITCTNSTVTGLALTNNLRVTGAIDGQSNARGSINIALLPAFADNVAAAAGGLIAGDVYRTDGTGATPPFTTAGLLMIL
jgi:hypothetical protein